MKKNKTQFWFFRRDFQIILGAFFFTCSILLILSLFSHIFTGREDQAFIEAHQSVVMNNWLGTFGARLSYFFIYELFGITTLLFPFLLVAWSIYFFTKEYLSFILRMTSLFVFSMFWLSLSMGYIVYVHDQLMNTDIPISLNYYCGYMGYRLVAFFYRFIGHGTPLLLLLFLFIFLVYFFGIEKLSHFFLQIKKILQAMYLYFISSLKDVKNKKKTLQKSTSTYKNKKENLPPSTEGDKFEKTSDVPSKKLSLEKTPVPSGEDNEVAFSIENTDKEALQKKEKSNSIINNSPKLGSSSYKYPPLSLLNYTENKPFNVTREELEVNKNKIIVTLRDFKINISSIRATIGPTVTLYEIVPEAGVKISKIKSLEDDIALNLAALGIRIIAPMPGKGTIGIEVPNKNRSIVSIRDVLGHPKFENSDYILPIALGKTISNENFIIDLAKMPHLLLAGATGQGKSVGLNVLLTSLLYKKHPSELKFILIDPKKVELSLFNKIEKHFLATLPFAEESIITDTTQVSKVLNCLCTEMEIRYNLLKEANCRNIQEYNKKFIDRQLNIDMGYKFLPYIVLVIDELADLMMVSGKEVEFPIARLAQLARAIGIHLVIATQRPSVDIITGLIKANFPARLSFKVISKIDSRTILDTSGADQLIGMGDMLFSNGATITRVQCAFIDTQEVKNVCNFIEHQESDLKPYFLPEVEDTQESKKTIDLKNRDTLFEQSAKLIVSYQQGSASLLQRKLSIGYNRAGRIIDQLEAAGVVGPFDGSKAREVLIKDGNTLENIIEKL